MTKAKETNPSSEPVTTSQTGEPTSNTATLPSKTVMVATSVGALAGLGYAFYQKKQFWGYVGFFLLGSLAGTLVGQIVDKTTK